jgi:hypothetical protein
MSAGEGYSSRYIEGAASEPQSLLDTPTPQMKQPWNRATIGSSRRSNQTPGGSARGRRSADDTFTSEAISGVAGLSDATVSEKQDTRIECMNTECEANHGCLLFLFLYYSHSTFVRKKWSR